MSVRGTFTALAFAALFVLPTLASSAIVEKWHTAPAANYILVSPASDLDGNGTLEMITLEFVSGGAKVGIRAAATGALLAQTAATYQPAEFWIANVDGQGAVEILFTDPTTGLLTCLKYTTGQSTLAVAWSYMPTANGVPTKWAFVDFDGNGQLYLVFKDESGGTNRKYYVRDDNGGLVTTLDLTTAPFGSGWNSELFVDDYDVDGRMELMIDYHNTSVSQDILYVIENNSPAPELAAAVGMSESPSVGQRVLVAPHKVERAQDGPSVRGNAELDTRTPRRAVRLP
jgi:hypothetical protein